MLTSLTPAEMNCGTPWTLAATLQSTEPPNPKTVAEVNPQPENPMRTPTAVGVSTTNVSVTKPGNA